MQRFDSNRIRQLFKISVSFFLRLFAPEVLEVNSVHLRCPLSIAIQTADAMFIFLAHPSVNHHLSRSLIYVMFSEFADFYLNDKPLKQ